MDMKLSQQLREALSIAAYWIVEAQDAQERANVAMNEAGDYERMYKDLRDKASGLESDLIAEQRKRVDAERGLYAADERRGTLENNLTKMNELYTATAADYKAALKKIEDLTEQLNDFDDIVAERDDATKRLADALDELRAYGVAK